jgi:hypothetical protein
MATAEHAEELLHQLDPYIQKSARHASEHFLRNNIELIEFEKIEMKMTPDLCAMLYRIMIKDLIAARAVFANKYGLLVILSPSHQGDHIVFSVKLGVTFTS